MKIISFEKTVLLKLGVLSRAEGQIYLPELIAAMTEKFHFVKFPDLSSINDDNSGGLQFFQGKFKNFAIDSLGIFSDGVVIKSNTNTSNLDDLALFIERWAKKEFGVEFIPSSSASTIYESNIVVQSASDSVWKAFQKLGKIEKSIASKLTKDSNMAATYSLASFALWVETCQIDSFKPAPFRFERRAGAEKKLGQFFSTAPLTTASHLELLNELESLA